MTSTIQRCGHSWGLNLAAKPATSKVGDVMQKLEHSRSNTDESLCRLQYQIARERCPKTTGNFSLCTVCGTGACAFASTDTSLDERCSLPTLSEISALSAVLFCFGGWL
jgi:hypothetical protein